jgi:hypothetical protein
MGWSFRMADANIVAFLTASNARYSQAAPRVSREDLSRFLFGLQRPERNRFYSNRRDWLKSIQDANQVAQQRLANAQTDETGNLHPAEVRKVTSPLRRVFGRFPLVGLAVADIKNQERAERFVRHAGETSGPFGMFLSPDPIDERKQAHLVLDPFPAIAQIGNFPERLPGVVFWTRTDLAVFAGFDEAEELYEKMRTDLFAHALSGDSHEPIQPGIEKRLRSVAARSASVKVTHLSDLHFGQNGGFKSKRFLLNHLRGAELADTDHVVITGDLLANPTKEAAELFEDFRYDLTSAIGGKNVIVIPGNHDRKWLGNSVLGVGVAPLLDLNWKRVHIDPKLRIAFLCFDSSVGANWAKGSISKDQLKSVGLELQEQLQHYENPKQFLKVALIHHHPFTFETYAETKLQRFLGLFGKSDEQFLLLENAGEVLAWCAEVGVSLILHGHKHVPRHVEGLVKRKDGSFAVLTSVGCGSSLGAEETPLCYDIVRWDPASKSWTVSFFSDTDHSGFSQDAVAIHYGH